MYLVQILLPIYNNSGIPFPRRNFEEIKAELTTRFGGITAFLSSPAEGLWREHENKVSRDDVVIFEVMVGTLDRRWWRGYRSDLENRFQQAEMIVRASVIEKL